MAKTPFPPFPFPSSPTDPTTHLTLSSLPKSPKAVTRDSIMESVNGSVEREEDNRCSFFRIGGRDVGEFYLGGVGFGIGIGIGVMVFLMLCCLDL